MTFHTFSNTIKITKQFIYCEIQLKSNIVCPRTIYFCRINKYDESTYSCFTDEASVINKGTIVSSIQNNCL